MRKTCFLVLPALLSSGKATFAAVKRDAKTAAATSGTAASSKVVRPREAAQRTLLATDFGWPKLKVSEQKSARVAGVLAAPWRDGSEWARAWVRYGLVRENKRVFQRMDVYGLEEGRADVLHLLPPLRTSGTLTLEMTLKGAAGTPLRFGIRQQDYPWLYVWQRDLQLSERWQTLRYTFPTPAGTQPVILILEVLEVGHLDLARCKLSETPSLQNTVSARIVAKPGG